MLRDTYVQKVQNMVARLYQSIAIVRLAFVVNYVHLVIIVRSGRNYSKTKLTVQRLVRIKHILQRPALEMKMTVYHVWLATDATGVV